MRRRSIPEAAAGGAGRLLDGALVLIAVVGLAVVVARVAGAALGLELVRFETGSMSPAYPQGAIAVAQRTPIDDLRVGDVVTVPRSGLLPITHRVVAVQVRHGVAELRLKGDANRDADPTAYRTASASRVLLGLPPVLAPLGLLATPAGTAAGFVLAALAVAWALWPRVAPARAAAPAT